MKEIRSTKNMPCVLGSRPTVCGIRAWEYLSRSYNFFFCFYWTVFGILFSLLYAKILLLYDVALGLTIVRWTRTDDCTVMCLMRRRVSTPHMPAICLCMWITVVVISCSYCTHWRNDDDATKAAKRKNGIFWRLKSIEISRIIRCPSIENYFVAILQTEFKWNEAENTH